MRYHKFSKTSLLLTALYLVGCGGGSSGATSVNAKQETLRLGEAMVSYSGNVLPLVSGGGNGVTITSMAGSSFGSLELVPNQTLANTTLAYDDDAIIDLYANGSKVQLEGLTQGLFYAPCFTHDGHLVTTGFDAKSNSYQVFESNYDGSVVTKLTSTSQSGLANVSWAPNGSKMAYDSSNGVYTANANGSGETLLWAGAVDPAISPDSTKVAFSLPYSGKNQIFALPIGGGNTLTKLSVSTGAAANNCYSPAWSPDGQWVAFNVDTGSDQYIEIQRSSGAPGFYDLNRGTPASQFDNQPTFSPDGASIAFMRSSSYEKAGSLTISGPTGDNPVTVESPDPAGLSKPSWSPFPSNRFFIGASGSMFTTASGFLWGQTGDVFCSLVAFTAVDPTSATITLQGTQANNGLVYDLHADTSGINGLKYANAYYGTVTTVINSSSTTVTDVLVTFDSTTGKVDTLAPFVMSRTAGQPAFKTSGNLYEVSGHFAGIWNGKGVNIAPNGASEILIDKATGRLARFQ